MKTCDRTACRRFLDDRMSDIEISSLSDHLSGCVQCQRWLEEEAGSGDDWKTARTLLFPSSDVAHWPTSQEAQSLSSESDLFHHSRQPIDLSFLSPTDDPAHLGRLGLYEITGVIGRGGMGIVLKATDSSLNRHVAIKVLDPTLAGLGAARQRFAREARAMAAISHEHVLPIFSVDENHRVPYFAMEYVAGGTLENRLRKDGPLDLVSIIRVAIQIAQALAAAHQTGLVHRDIKPANILLDRGVERVRVADFGLARVANNASETRSGIVAGTPQYMSPEQVRGESCDGRSDLFSLGSVIYAMCAGHAPFRAESVYGVMQRIVHSQPRPVREQNPRVPAWLECFIDKLLEKDRNDRFASAEEVVAVLSRELAALQSPRTGPAPDRPWMRPRPRISLAFNPRHALGILGAAALFAVAVWWPEKPNVGDLGTDPLPPARQIQSISHVPLWDVDGTSDLRNRANHLESQLFTPSTSSLDPWSNETHSLRQRLAEIAQSSF